MKCSWNTLSSFDGHVVPEIQLRILVLLGFQDACWPQARQPLLQPCAKVYIWQSYQSRKQIQHIAAQPAEAFKCRMVQWYSVVIPHAMIWLQVVQWVAITCKCRDHECGLILRCYRRIPWRPSLRFWANTPWIEGWGYEVSLNFKYSKRTWQNYWIPHSSTDQWSRLTHLALLWFWISLWPSTTTERKPAHPWHFAHKSKMFVLRDLVLSS